VVRQERIGVGGKLVLALEQLAPDLRGGGQVRQEVAERLDRQPAVIADVAQRRERAVPGNAARSRYAAVVLRDVHVRDPRAGPADRGGRILLFDVRVEGVQVDAAVRVVDLVDAGDRLVEGVQVVP